MPLPACRRSPCMSGAERVPLEFCGARTAELSPDQLIFPAVPKLPDVIEYRSAATVRACPGELDEPPDEPGAGNRRKPNEDGRG